MEIKKRYLLNKSIGIGCECYCPSCGSKFIKKTYQQVFCKTKPGTQCKDKYWNTVIPEKRNNRTRFSPSSLRWIEKNKIDREDNWNLENEEHIFSSEGLGQY